MRVITLTMTGSAQQVFVPNQQAPAAIPYASMMIVQPYTADVTLGDNTVAAGNGILIPVASFVPITFSQPRGSALSNYWLIGTSGDKVCILYETAQ